MNLEMAYLLGMVCGNGTIKRGSFETTVSIDIPHKKLQTDDIADIKLYVKASIADIKNLLEPLLGTGLSFIQNKSATVLTFTKNNKDYLMTEVLRFVGNATTHDNIRLDISVFSFTRDARIQFLRGFCDVTGYIRRSNYFFEKYMHRVYIEIPHNWQLVADICNLLKSVDVPVQTIDWAHPNMRDGKCVKYNQGKHDFWKKEHQIKIWANEFLPIGFGVVHKQLSLNTFADELINGLIQNGKENVSKETHKFYWETKSNKKKVKPPHPAESDDFIPHEIRGQHFNSWRDIAEALGYHE